MSLRDEICQLAEEKQELFTSVSDRIWATPELGFKEEKSASALIEVLESQGFSIETGLAGIPTAFSATFGSGKPVVGFLGEFDALPNLSQKVIPEKDAVEEGGNGHGCGHNALGAGSMGAAITLKEYMEKNDVKGTVIFYGCPGEEFGCGKAFMSRAGCFDNLDFALSWHPGDSIATWSVSSLANISVFFSFEGVTAHAAGAPHMGRSALDAAELMNVGVQFLREHIIPEARVHYAFCDVGGQAPNVVQDRAKLHYYIRAPKIDQAQAIFDRIKKIAAGAALMTETTSVIQIKDGLCDFVPNQTITAILGSCMEEVGPIAFDEADYALAKQFQATLNPDSIKGSMGLPVMSFGMEEAQAQCASGLYHGVMPYRQMNMVVPGSTDVGDVSYVTPTAQLTATTACAGTPAHTWQMTAQSGSPMAHKGLLFAAKSLALCAAKVMAQPDVMEQAHKEYMAVTGGVYTCPFPDDVQPYFG